MTTAAGLEVDGAGVTVRMPAGETQDITATDPVTLHVERLQDELQQGACVDATCTRTPAGHGRPTSSPPRGCCPTLPPDT